MALDQGGHIALRLRVDRSAQVQALGQIRTLVGRHQALDDGKHMLDLVVAQGTALLVQHVRQQIVLAEGERLGEELTAGRPGCINVMRIAFARPCGQRRAVAGAVHDHGVVVAVVGATDVLDEPGNVGQRILDGQESQALERGVAVRCCFVRNECV